MNTQSINRFSALQFFLIVSALLMVATFAPKTDARIAIHYGSHGGFNIGYGNGYRHGYFNHNRRYGGINRYHHPRKYFRPHRYNRDRHYRGNSRGHSHGYHRGYRNNGRNFGYHNGGRGLYRHHPYPRHKRYYRY